MGRLEDLEARRQEIIQDINNIGEMRKGSITEQVFKSKKADGSTVQRGPYWVYSYKDRGKTVSKRLSPQEVGIYEAQILEFRRFESLCSELAEASQAICDIRLREGGEGRAKKKLRKPSHGK